jgi:hypothetical protein
MDMAGVAQDGWGPRGAPGAPPRRRRRVVTQVVALGFAAAGLLPTAGCKMVDQRTAAAVIRRDVGHLSVRNSNEPSLEIELTGYLVDPFEQEKFELMKSLPELFTLDSLAARPARQAFFDIRGHGELLPLAVERGAMEPVPAEPDRMLQRYEITLPHPALASTQPGANDRKVAFFPLRDWEFHEISVNFPYFLRPSAHVVITKSPNATFRLLRRGLSERQPWLADRLCCLGQGRFPADAKTYSYDICLFEGRDGWLASAGCK